MYLIERTQVYAEMQKFHGIFTMSEQPYPIYALAFSTQMIVKILALLIFFSFLAACSGGGGSGEEGGSISSGETAPGPVDEMEQAEQYNILLIIADDLAYDHYGFAGHPVLKTPSIDSLSAQSVRFPTTYVSSSCRPTLATLLTGLPEHIHEVTYIEGPSLGDLPTIADYLVNVGYSTFQAGKFWEGRASVRGFTGNVPFDSLVGNGSIGRTSIDPIFDFMEETSSPWFVWFSPRMPHSPHNAPKNFIAMYEEMGLDTATVEYFAMISWFDTVVGTLLQEIDDNTVVIFLADNGYVQSEIPEIFAPKSKASLYEHGIRTQLLIRHPKHDAILRTELSSAVDVAATILSIAGADYSDLPGRDLLAPAPPDTPAFGSRSSLGIYSPPPGVLLERWTRVDEWKLVDVESGDDRLHNLTLDPEENVNLIDDAEYSTVRANLQNVLETLWSEY